MLKTKKNFWGYRVVGLNNQASVDLHKDQGQWVAVCNITKPEVDWSDCFQITAPTKREVLAEVACEMSTYIA